MQNNNFVNKYTANRMVFAELENSVVVPSFQRRLVWSKVQKENFIKTLHNKYPFGSILIYRYGDEGSKSKFSLIDGLQRYTTIIDFKNNPTKYINFDNFTEEIMEYISSNLPPKTLSQYRKSITTELVKIVNLGRNNANGIELYNVLEGTIPFIIEPNVKILNVLADIQKRLFDFVESYLDISKIEVPFIEFTGNQSELAEVFENLNRGGKKLTKYQVFAAQWSKYEFELPSSKYAEEILNLVVKRYEDLTDERDITIEGFDGDQMKKDRIINLSEFCYGLGVLIIKSMDVFWGNSTSEDLANEIGYSTLAIVLGKKNKDMHLIINKSDLFIKNDQDFIETLVNAILVEYVHINSIFSHRFKMRGTQKIKYYSGEPSNFQIMSYFAMFWRVKYETITKSTLTKKQLYLKDYNKVCENLFNHYLLDYVTKSWSGAGDSKLDSIAMENDRYLHKVENDKVSDALLNWWDERKTSTSIRFDNVSKLLFVIFASYHEESYKRPSYDFEHVVPTGRVKDIYKHLKLPMGSLGNMMLLDYSDNRSKGLKTLYENETELMKLNTNFLNEICYPSDNEFVEIFRSLDKNDDSVILSMFDKRAKHIINYLHTKL